MNTNYTKAIGLYRTADARQKAFLETWAKGSIQNSLTCQTALVTDLLKQGSLDVGSLGFDYNEVANLYEEFPTDAEIEDMGLVEMFKLWSDTVETSIEKLIVKEFDLTDYTGDRGELDVEQMDMLLLLSRGDESASEDHFAGWFDIYDFTEQVEIAVKDAIDTARDEAEAKEVYEWWLVTDTWLAARLGDLGEALLDNNYGTWWGRTCTGQAIYLDNTIQLCYVQAFGLPNVPEAEEEKP